MDSVFSNDDKMDKGVDTKDLDLSNYLETLVKKLSVIRTGKHSFSKEVTYAELLRLVRNCEKLNLDFDLLIGSKLGKYLHLAYIILLEINDTSSIGYQRLLPRISKIRKICKERILSFVNIFFAKFDYYFSTIREHFKLSKMIIDNSTKYIPKWH